MSYDIMSSCADMILADAIEDLSEEEKIPLETARDRLLESEAYQCLYNFDTRLWMEGPDYFRDFYRKVEEVEGRR